MPNSFYSRGTTDDLGTPAAGAYPKQILGVRSKVAIGKDVAVTDADGAVPVQDDVREKELIGLFDLKRLPGAKRHETDAVLIIYDKEVPFELKSATKQGVTTVRDFGPEHIRKWREKHWLFGFHRRHGRQWMLDHCYYATPAQMAPWISQKAEYIKLDFDLADYVPELVTTEVLHKLLGRKEVYGFEDALVLQKRQYKKDKYLALMDRGEGYSEKRMLEILRDRCRYVISRGATLNNPHIPATYFERLHRIDEDHAGALRTLVSQYLHASASATPTATR